MRIFILCIIIANTYFANAQFDTSYVFLTRNYFALNTFVESASSELYYDYKNTSTGHSSSVSYTTRNYNSIGFGASFYRLGFSLSFELPSPFSPELSNQNALNFRGGYSYKRLYGELRIRNYRGLVEHIINADNSNETINVRRNFRIKQYGGQLYFFTSRKFNYDANFKNYNIQRKSAISPMLSLGTSYYNLIGNFVLTPLDNKFKNQVFSRFNNYSLRFLPGIAFTFIYKRLYIAATGGIGVASNLNDVYVNDKNEKYWSFTPVMEANATLGYSTKQFFTAFVFLIENDRVTYSNFNLGALHTLFSIKFGKKINIKYLGKLGKYL